MSKSEKDIPNDTNNNTNENRENVQENNAEQNEENNENEEINENNEKEESNENNEKEESNENNEKEESNENNEKEESNENNEKDDLTDEKKTNDDNNDKEEFQEQFQEWNEEKLINSPCTSNFNPENEDIVAKISTQSSNISIMCRICYDDTLDEPIISPCKCKGTVGMMHKSCLEKWLAESNTNRCDLCFHKFETERTTKFSVYESIYRWMKYPPGNFAFPIRDMRSDMITCFILIPFSFLLVYLCLFAGEYYNRQNFTVMSVARWTSLSVLFMGIIIILGFCTWMYLVLRYHSRVWYFWWQRETIVRIHIPALIEK